MNEQYNEMLRQLGLATLVLLELHAEDPPEYPPQYLLERLANAYMDIGVKNNGWPDDEDL